MATLLLMAMLLVTTSKTPTGDKVVYHNEIAVVTGTFTAHINQNESVMSHVENINYPTGFNVSNTAVISIGLKRTDQVLLDYSFGTLSDEAAVGYVNSAIGKSVVINSNDMQLKTYYNFGAPRSATDIPYSYKIVLLKIS